MKFANESKAYRIARNRLLIAEKALRRKIETVAALRGWDNLRLLSSADNDYNRDYHGEGPDGSQWPMLNVFVRRKGAIRHFWGSELLGSKAEPGQNGRHVDMLWPLWSALDLTPEGRGRDWYPKLEYAELRGHRA